jgi:signal peptide peptidase SppA
MKYAHILSRVTGTPWFIQPSALNAITDLLESRLRMGALGTVRSELDKKDDELEPNAPAYQVRSGGGIAIVPVRGILGKHLSMMETMCGGCDYDAVVAAVRAAAADPGITSVILALDSRGGTATGAGECFAALREIRSETGKPLYAFTDTVCASAAYYLAAACDAIFSTVSAQVGSIGSMLTVVDVSEADAKEGIKRFTFKSATMKDICNPGRPMTEEEKSFLQGQVDYIGGLFRSDMQQARPAIVGEVFEKGLFYYGGQAQALGLIDTPVASLDELIASLSGTVAQ